MLYRLTLRAIAAYLRFALYRYKFYPTYGRRFPPWMHKKYLAWNALRDPTTFMPLAPRELTGAIERAGGIDVVYGRLRRAHRYGRAAVYAATLMARGDVTCGFRTQGLDDVIAAAEDGPVVVIETHVGPHSAVMAQLMRAGLHIVTYTSAPRGYFAAHARIAKALGLGDPTAGWTVLDRGASPFATARALNTIGPRDVFMWQPDSDVRLSTYTRPHSRFLGLPIVRQRTVERLVARQGGRVFIAVARLDGLDSPQDITVRYEEVSFAGGEMTEVVYNRSEQVIVDNMDEWRPLGLTESWMDDILPTAARLRHEALELHDG